MDVSIDYLQLRSRLPSMLRNLSDEQVTRIHRALAGLWAEDADLASLLTAQF